MNLFDLIKKAYFYFNISNLQKMDSVAYKPQILETFENVRNFSFEEKKEAVMNETKMNKFLDRIIDFKKSLKIKTDKIEEIIESSEKISWFNHLDDDSLLIVNDLVSSIRNLHSSLHRQYISLQYIREKGIAKVEMKNFISAIDDLKEIANDLDSRFFFLPNNDEFDKITKELSQI